MSGPQGQGSACDGKDAFKRSTGGLREGRGNGLEGGDGIGGKFIGLVFTRQRRW
ncbi:MAG: hypothetical protein WCK27_11135 [Verrucomicrobiota bacterium]